MRLWVGLAGGITILLLVLSGAFFWLVSRQNGPRLAPEADKVLQAQIGLPFQPLIPAYLPALFDREKVDIQLDQPGPHGEKMFQLSYSTPRGNQLVLQEWLPEAEPAGPPAVDQSLHCNCVCSARGLCSPAEVGLSVGALRVAVKLSAANLLSYDQLRFVLDTLGPAANQQVFSRMAEVPLSLNLPPAVEIPVNADGVQEITLVVTPDGYNPVHFAVKKGIPARLVFRQLGQVGCGNQLVFQWGKEKNILLTLTTPADKKTLEFTPETSGDFRFNCPHLIYRGVMSVEE